MPYRTASDGVADDWFEVELASGPATFELLRHPDGAGMAAVVYDGNLDQVTTFSYAGFSIGPREITAPIGGTYYVVLRGAAGELDPLVAHTLPGYMAETYEFRISQ